MAARVGPPPPHIVEREIESDLGLYNPEEDRVVMLNSTASDIWRLSDGDYTLEEIVDTLARAYGVEPATIRSQVEETVSRLIEQGFLTASEPS